MGWPVLSLLGVVLIARPQSLFGTASEIPKAISEIEKTVEPTSTQRLIAVGWVFCPFLTFTSVDLSYSTSYDKESLCWVYLVPPELVSLSQSMRHCFADRSCLDISLRAIGTRAHTMHSLTFFSSYSVIVSALGWTQCFPILKHYWLEGIRMLFLHIPPVIPKKWPWCGFLAAVGICGFIAQVCTIDYASAYPHILLLFPYTGSAGHGPAAGDRVSWNSGTIRTSLSYYTICWDADSWF